MEQILTNEERVLLLNQNKKRKQEEIYTLCVSLGIDYSSFDPATYVLQTPVENHEYAVLKYVSDTYVNIVAELASLE